MEVAFVTAPARDLLGAVRSTLADADEALVCVAFAQARGVHLVAKEVEAVARRGNARVVVTTAFGSSSEGALAALCSARAQVRVLNPGGGTYHPKVYLGRSGDRVDAVVGSANLTSGLVANVEVATRLRGSMADAPLRDLWSWAQQTWSDPRALDWAPGPGPIAVESIEPELLRMLVAVARDDPRVYTLGRRPAQNRVADVNASGIWVETQRTRERASGAQLVPPSMLNLAWDTLRTRGRLTNREMLEELRIHRSSFVSAVLARLPGVRAVPGARIELVYEG